MAKRPWGWPLTIGMAPRPDGHRATVVNARQFLHDDSLKTEDRVDGLLLLLYAQRPATISRLTRDQVRASEHDVRFLLGRSAIFLPEPLAGPVATAWLLAEANRALPARRQR